MKIVGCIQSISVAQTCGTLPLVPSDSCIHTSCCPVPLDAVSCSLIIFCARRTPPAVRTPREDVQFVHCYVSPSHTVDRAVTDVSELLEIVCPLSSYTEWPRRFVHRRVFCCFDHYHRDCRTVSETIVVPVVDSGQSVLTPTHPLPSGGASLS